MRQVTLHKNAKVRKKKKKRKEGLYKITVLIQGRKSSKVNLQSSDIEPNQANHAPPKNRASFGSLTISHHTFPAIHRLLSAGALGLPIYYPTSLPSLRPMPVVVVDGVGMVVVTAVAAAVVVVVVVVGLPASLLLVSPRLAFEGAEVGARDQRIHVL